VGLRGPGAAPKAWWRYAPRPHPKCRCQYCYRLFIGDRSTATFCGDACRQAAHREKIANNTKLHDRAQYGGKADIVPRVAKCPFMTQSGHAAGCGHSSL
jgi:hypothetical protein